MSALYYLIPLSLLILGSAVGVFIWSLRRGQYDDLKGPAHSVIFDDREEQSRLDRDRE